MCCILSSCKTYTKYNELSRWTDKWNDKYIILETKKYNRKNDSIISIAIDTLYVEYKPSNGSFIYN